MSPNRRSFRAEKKFFEPNVDLRQPDGSIPMLDDVHAVPMLANVTSEKGEGFFTNRARWRAESVFGMIEGICSIANAAQRRTRWAELGAQLGEYPLVVCDDDSKEIADFIAVDPPRKRLVFIHGKAKHDGNGRYQVSTLQEVGRQATASLAFISRTPPPQGWQPARWTGDVQANQIRLTGRNRVFKNAAHLSHQQITEALRTACGHPTYDKQVWIVGGKMLERAFVETAITNGNIDNRLWQFLLHWDGLRTACARAGAHLSLFCH
jgi:hypothetical protein